MDIGKILERLMSMDDTTWLRHANPISGWSRVTSLPLLAFAIWSRIWFGWWALGLLIIVIIWIWLNPRLFPKPKSTNNWMSKGVLGERVWLRKKQTPIPEHHIKIAACLNILSGFGAIPFAYGLIQLNIWAVILGGTIMMLAKLWFLDRMVWLFHDMKDVHEEYNSWLK